MINKAKTIFDKLADESETKIPRATKKCIKRTPTILQMEAVECGAASLAMIYAYYGLHIPLEKLRIECGVSRDGSKASNIIKSAKKRGFIAKGYKKEIENIFETKLPAIIFWDFYHFVVLEGFDKNWIYINDPSEGRKKISYEEFDKSFTGIVLTFEPGEHFKKEGKPTSIFPGLKRRLKGMEISIAFLVMVGMVMIIPSLVVPAFSQIFIDQILVQSKHSWLSSLIGAMIFTLVITTILNFLQKYYLLRLETNLAITTSSKFFKHILRLPMEFFYQRFSGDLSSRIPLNNSLAVLLSRDLATAVLSFITASFYLIILISYDITLTIVGIFIVTINILALKLIARKRIDLNKKLSQDQGNLTGIGMMGLSMIESLKASGHENDFFSRWASVQAKTVNTSQKLQVYTDSLMAIPPLLTSINTALILGIGSLRVMEGELTMGMLVAFSLLMNAFLNPINLLMNLNSNIQDAEGYINRIDDIWNYPINIQESDNNPNNVINTSTKTITKLSGNIEIKDLTFGYSKLEDPLITEFNLTLKPGTRVAIVGKSGSGKSTISRLVAGLYEPWSGEILFDGLQRNQIPRYLLSTSITMVDQEIFLFEGTVTENITMWDNTILFQNVLNASRDAHIHAEISARPLGYDNIIDEGGRNFSGGQKQRLEIARALVDNPSIIILDEATSALDPTTEKIIDENLRRRGCTCLIIAHRLSTIRDCDEIIVMERGKIVQRGTHEELKSIHGVYLELIRE
ncbi:MAG: NHLP family bacteriocin export ABC transporter peptidase/permease/ATPase subunit [Melioribacteraceae bacterium]